MNTETIRKVTGVTGLIAAILTLVEVPLYFVYSGPPPDSNVLLRSMLGLIGLTLLIVFMTGIRQLVRLVAPAYEWIGSLAATAGVAWLVVVLVSTGLEVGAVIAAPEPIDPTITVNGTYLLYGTIARLLEGLFTMAFGVAVLRSGVLPRWTGWSAVVMALVNAAFVPSLFFGNVPANFYAANGWGTTASMGAVTMLWLVVVNVTLLRTRTRTRTRARSPESALA
jgi:hypothetical protein